ncbi:hypothetical protein [Limoniibacter endophyticus]|uniref:Uncharacterized protein n=1 Tax=Limoniibacter endophyticus TaxID=1565040 RepID=A0A8J3GJL6_9HYPH|nr:hypothetical protein [Limoniibacter endophyticus]GHC79015.1 hypothetical protein GCM10010136_31200 [Limoniibacter endophyticus]
MTDYQPATPRDPSPAATKQGLWMTTFEAEISAMSSRTDAQLAAFDAVHGSYETQDAATREEREEILIDYYAKMLALLESPYDDYNLTDNSIQAFPETAIDLFA